MRHRLLIPVLFILSACASMNGDKVVDPDKLPPMTGQERALLISADASAASGDTAAAERNYLTAVAQSKGHIVAHLSLARLYESQNKLEKAENILKKAAEFQPGHVELNRLRGKIALHDDRPAEALEYFSAGLKSDQANLDLLTGAGIANDMMHRHDAGQVLYLRALSLHPNDDLAAVRSNLAMSYLLDDQAQKAVDLLKAEVKKPNAPAVMKHNLALAYGVLGRHVQARTLLGTEVSEEERLQSLKRLADHIAADHQKVHPVDKMEKTKTPKPSAVSRPDLQPKIRQQQ